jgi:hypothetical protein
MEHYTTAAGRHVTQSAVRTTGDLRATISLHWDRPKAGSQ